MEAKAQLVLLYEIGRHDQKLLMNKEQQVRLGKDSVIANETAEKLKQTAAELSQKKVDLLSRKKEVDEKLTEEKSKVRKWETRAEKIRGEREYSALISEISSLRRGITGLEGEVLEATQELKKVTDSLDKAQKEYEQYTNRGTEALLSVKEQMASEQEEANGIEKAKNALLEQLPAATVARYKKIREKRGEIGIAFLEKEICLQCRRKVPPELFLKVYKGEVIEQCPSCQRIVVTENFGHAESLG